MEKKITSSMFILFSEEGLRATRLMGIVVLNWRNTNATSESQGYRFSSPLLSNNLYQNINNMLDKNANLRTSKCIFLISPLIKWIQQVNSNQGSKLHLDSPS